jgi:RNA polymerase sigma-70 factor (ECF subfamily)
MEATNGRQQADRWVIFEASRTRLFRIALRIVGDADDAQDIVQDAALRWLQADLTEVRAPTGWLVSVVTHLAVDRLRRAATARQAYQAVGHAQATREPQWAAPDRPVELDSQLTMVLLALRERLEPVERTALVLREVFDCEYSEIAYLLDRSEAACRQIVHRALERVRRDRSRFAPRLAVTTDIVERFAAALSADDRDATLAAMNDGASISAFGRGSDRSRGLRRPSWRIAQQPPRWGEGVATASPAA